MFLFFISESKSESIFYTIELVNVFQIIFHGSLSILRFSIGILKVFPSSGSSIQSFSFFCIWSEYNVYIDNSAESP